METNLSVIIPAAGLGRRMKSYGPKSLISLANGEYLLTRQLNILHKAYPKAEIIVVLGYEADKVYKVLPHYVRTVENELYDETNVARSISLGLRACSVDTKKVLIVYGDLVFNEKLLTGLALDSSFVITDSNNSMSETEVGLTVTNNLISHLSYGLPTKWGQIAYLAGKELNLFKQIIYNRMYGKYYGYEILNMLIEQGGKIKSVEPKNMWITDIDSSKDIDRAIELLNKDK